MSSLYERLAMKEKEAKEKKLEEKRQNQAAASGDRQVRSPVDEGSSAWLSSSANRSTTSPDPVGSSIGAMFEPYYADVSALPLADLVWAPYSGLRGGEYGRPCPGRLCASAKVAAVPNLVLPVPHDKCVVEFFGMPKDHQFWWRFLIVYKKDVRPYHAPPAGQSMRQGTLSFATKDDGEDVSQRWDLSSSSAMHDELVKKTNKAKGGAAHRAIMSVANDFLRAALDEEQAFVSSQKDGVGVSADYDTTTINEEEGDLAEGADFYKEHAHREAGTVTLQAGDYIRYRDNIHQSSFVSIVNEVCLSEKHTSLLLQTGDAVCMTDIIHKFDQNGEGGYVADSGSSWALQDFKLVQGKLANADSFAKLQKRSAEEGNARLFEKTGVIINEGVKRQRQGLTSPTCAKKKKK